MTACDWKSKRRRFAVRISLLSLLVVCMSSDASLSSDQNKDNASADLLESGQASKIKPAPANPKDLTIVTYNIRWRDGEQLRKIGDWLREKQPAMVALQEVDRARERTDKTNNARVLAEALGMYYAWAAPPATRGSNEEETGVEILSPYPLADVTRIVLPNRGPGGRLRVALGATIKFEKTSIRFYSVHSETRIATTKKIEQLRAVLDDLARFSKTSPAVVMGDLNSWEPATVKAVRELFSQEGFTTPFPDNETTFKRGLVFFDLTLKLDWIWLRGLTVKSHGIDRTITVSDHFPLWVMSSAPPAEPTKP